MDWGFEIFSKFPLEVGKEQQEAIVKLAIASFLGMIIGIEREIRKKPLGLKTCMIISILSCLITIVSIESAYTFPVRDHITMDPLRLAAQIVSGIGFLGAGVILRKNNDVILGLTTAAMIWGAAGIGIAVGAGFHVESMAAVLFMMLAVEIVPRCFSLGKQLFKQILFLLKKQQKKK